MLNVLGINNNSHYIVVAINFCNSHTSIVNILLISIEIIVLLDRLGPNIGILLFLSINRASINCTIINL